MINKNICFVVNADEKIGIGHLIRSIVLAEEFALHSFDVCFITNSPFVLGKCKEKKLNCYCIDKNDSDYTAQFIRILIKHDVRVIVFDLLEEQLKRHSFVARFGNLLIVSITIFHYKHRRFEDICIYPGLVEIEEKIFKGDANTHIPYFSGTKFLIIRNEFEKIRRKKIRSSADKVLVTMGGSDPGNFTEKVLESIILLKNPVQCDIVLGKNFELKTDIYHKYSKFDHFNFYEDIDNLAELMQGNDIAVINGGTTRYELSIIGTPYMAISLHQTQFDITETLAKQNACLNLGIGNDLEKNKIAKAIKNFLNDYELRKNISQNMKQLFDMNGKRRIFDIIQAHLVNEK